MFYKVPLVGSGEFDQRTILEEKYFALSPKVLRQTACKALIFRYEQPMVKNIFHPLVYLIDIVHLHPQFREQVDLCLN